MTFYNRAKYSEAAAKLLLSFQYAPEEAYSDKCLYYLAYSEFRQENKAAAVEYMSKLASNYPDSSYHNRASNFVKNHK